jgi:hypothetical protein
MANRLLKLSLLNEGLAGLCVIVSQTPFRVHAQFAATILNIRAP